MTYIRVTPDLTVLHTQISEIEQHFDGRAIVHVGTKCFLTGYDYIDLLVRLDKAGSPVAAKLLLQSFEHWNVEGKKG